MKSKKIILYFGLVITITVLISWRVFSTSGVGGRALEVDASQLSSGVYIYRLQAGDFIDIMKLLLLK